MTATQSLYINNMWTSGQGKEIISINPANGNTVWKGRSASKEDVHSAFQAARNALPVWSSRSLDERKRYLKRFAEVLSEEKDHLARAISLETGKPLWESKTEVAAMIGKVDISIDAYNDRCRGMQKELQHGALITRHRPHGVVAIIGPFNFPGHLPNGHIIPALLAGNTILFKPSELTPYVAECIVRLWEKIELPKGVLNLLQGGGATGESILHHPDLNGLFFTGSWKTGKLILQYMNDQPDKILALEMGGNNPLIIGGLADLKAAAYLTIQSAYITAGQRCTCARRLVLTQTAQSEQFLNELIRMIGKIKVGAFDETPQPFMGPVIAATAAKHLLEEQQQLLEKGAVSLIPMRPLKENTGFLSPGLIDTTHVKEREDKEIFGPLLQVIKVPDLDAAIREANRTSFGLAAGFIGDSKEQYMEVYRHVRAGVINWNSQLTGASSSAPFGGLGKSGNFRPSAYYAADYCAYPVASIESETLQLPATLHEGIRMNEAS